MSALEIFSNQHVRKLQERNFRVVRGFNLDVARALHNGINDPVITEFTRDAERFETLEKTLELHEQESQKIFYSLVDTAIKGVIWFGPSEIQYSDAPTTFAIRIYTGGRGRGLAGDFIEAAHEDFTTDQGGDTWLKVQAGNETARGLYLKHGYEISSDTPRGIVMTRRSD